MIPDMKDVSFKFHHFNGIFVDAVFEEEIVDLDDLSQKIHVDLDNPIYVVRVNIFDILEQEYLQPFDCSFYDFRVDER